MNTRTAIVGSASLSLAATMLSVAATATSSCRTDLLTSRRGCTTRPPGPGLMLATAAGGLLPRKFAEAGGNGVAPTAFAFSSHGASVGACMRRGQRRRRRHVDGQEYPSSSPSALPKCFVVATSTMGGDETGFANRRTSPRPRCGGRGGHPNADYHISGLKEAAAVTPGDGRLTGATAAPRPAATRGMDCEGGQNDRRRGGSTDASFFWWQQRRTGARRRRLSRTPCHGSDAALLQRLVDWRFRNRGLEPSTVVPAMAAAALRMTTREDGNAVGSDQGMEKNEGDETSDAASRGWGGLESSREESTNDREYSFPDDEEQSLTVDEENDEEEAYFGDDVDDLYSFDEEEDFQAYDDATLLELLEKDDEDIIGPDAFDLLEMERAMDSIDLWNDGDGDGAGGIHGASEESNPDDPSHATGSPSAVAAPGADNPLERALLEGVVPADAGVGSGSLPGDYGFDPLNLASMDYIQMVQSFLLRYIPPSPYQRAMRGEPSTAENTATEPRVARPPALILRDYREAEIRHGRLAMLAAVLWPMQELIDRFFLPVDEYKTTIVYGGPTLPYLSLLMTLIMMLLGYLDIYASAVKEGEAGDAFLPGECFWDPLKMLDGAPDAMKKRMQERELNNGRMAMVAVAAYFLQEAIFHRPVVSLEWNQILFEPAFEIPAVQHWLDERFESPSPTFYYPAAESGRIDFVEIVKETLKEDGL